MLQTQTLKLNYKIEVMKYIPKNESSNTFFMFMIYLQNFLKLFSVSIVEVQISRKRDITL